MCQLRKRGALHMDFTTLHVGIVGMPGGQLKPQTELYAKGFHPLMCHVYVGLPTLKAEPSSKSEVQ